VTGNTTLTGNGQSVVALGDFGPGVPVTFMGFRAFPG
jgi:hypothetical protein